MMGGWFAPPLPLSDRAAEVMQRGVAFASRAPSRLAECPQRRERFVVVSRYPKGAGRVGKGAPVRGGRGG